MNRYAVIPIWTPYTGDAKAGKADYRDTVESATSRAHIYLLQPTAKAPHVVAIVDLTDQEAPRYIAKRGGNVATAQNWVESR